MHAIADGGMLIQKMKVLRGAPDLVNHRFTPIGVGAGVRHGLVVAAFTVLSWVNAGCADVALQGIREFFPTNGQPRFPACRLLEVSNGVFYGTSLAGGTNGRGAVFKITAAGELTVLHSFTASEAANGADGGLVWGDDGNLYGSTPDGGEFGSGSVFRVTPDGAVTTTHSFGGGGSASTNGLQPIGPLEKGDDGALYGTTSHGGAAGYGTVFRITTNEVFTRLASFQGTNGAHPWSGLMRASDGNFYGMTYGLLSAADHDGSIFKFSTNGELSALVRFDGANGSSPQSARLVQGADGNFYGATKLGGPFYRGTVFRTTPDGTLTTLHSFDGTNGAFPQRLTFGSDGDLYGLASHRVENGNLTNGALFKITTNGLLTMLACFNGTNAMHPTADLTMGSD